VKLWHVGFFPARLAMARANLIDRFGESIDSAVLFFDWELRQVLKDKFGDLPRCLAARELFPATWLRVSFHWPIVTGLGLRLAKSAQLL
jgi:hypothetical protein